MTVEKWNTEFLNDLKYLCGEERICALRRFSFAAECKQLNEYMDSSILREVLGKFDSVDSDLFLIVCLNLANIGTALKIDQTGTSDFFSIDFVDINRKKKARIGFYCLWRMVRQDDCLKVIKSNDHQDATLQKHVIVLELSKVFSGDAASWTSIKRDFFRD